MKPFEPAMMQPPSRPPARPSAVAALALSAVLAALAGVASAQVTAESAPPSPSGPADTLVQQYLARKQVADDEKAAPADRDQASRDMLELLEQIVPRFPDDPRIHAWRAELVDKLLNYRAHSHYQKMVYEIATRQEMDRQADLLARCDGMISASLPEIEKRQTELENRPHFNVDEWDRLEQVRQPLDYGRVRVDFFRAQLAWVRGARVAGAATPADKASAELLLQTAQRTTEFFSGFSGDPEPLRRGLALMFQGWAALFAGQTSVAANTADRVINDAELAVGTRFEAYTLKAQALREERRYGGSSLLSADDVRNWVRLCVELSKQKARVAPGPAKRVWELLDPEARKQIDAGANRDLPEDGRRVVIDGLNAILDRTDFYRAEDFKGAPLPGDARNLLERGLSRLPRPALQRFNRLAMETALVGMIAEARLGALAVLDEQAGLVAAEEGLTDPMWLVFNLLGRANVLVRQAADATREQHRQARELESRGEVQAAGKLREQALGEYAAGRDAAIQMLLDAGKQHERAMPLLNAVVDMVWTEPEFETQALGPTDLTAPPSAEEMKNMPTFRLRRLAEQAYNNQKWHVAEVCYKALQERARSIADKALSENQRGDALFGLGRTYYYWARTLGATEPAETVRPEDGAAPAPRPSEQLHLKSVQTLSQLRSELADYGDTAFILKMIGSSLLHLPTVYGDPQQRDLLIKTLRELKGLSADQELDDTRLDLGWALFNAGRYAEAAVEFREVTAQSPYYPDARELEVRCLLRHYTNYRRQPGDTQKVLDDLARMIAFETFALEQAAKPPPPPTTQPAATQPDEPIDWRDLGATFKLEAGRLYFDQVDSETDALSVFDKVIDDYADLPNIVSRARGYKIQILLARQQYQKAIVDLLELIKQDPERAEDLIDDVLMILEKEFKQLRAEEKPGDALVKARQAEQFATALAEQAARDEGVDKKTLNDIIMRRGRALNWVGRHQEALQILESIYVPPPPRRPDGTLDPDAQYTTDVDELVELADAKAAVGQLAEAEELYGRVTALRDYTLEEFWRGLIGWAECRMQLDPSPKSLEEIHFSLISNRDDAERQATVRRRADDDPRLPEWLRPRFNALLRQLTDAGVGVTGPVQAAVQAPQAAVEKRGLSQGTQVLMLLGGGVGAFLLVLIAYAVYVRGQHRRNAALDR